MNSDTWSLIVERNAAKAKDDRLQYARFHWKHAGGKKCYHRKHLRSDRPTCIKITVQGPHKNRQGVNEVINAENLNVGR